jgi:hypothetical protein
VNQVDLFNHLGALEYNNSIPTVQTKIKIAMQQAGGIMFWNPGDDS